MNALFALNINVWWLLLFCDICCPCSQPAPADLKEVAAHKACVTFNSCYMLMCAYDKGIQSVGECLQWVGKSLALGPGQARVGTVCVTPELCKACIHLSREGKDGPTSGTTLPLSGKGLGRTWSLSIKRVASRQAAPPRPPHTTGTYEDTLTWTQGGRRIRSINCNLKSILGLHWTEH